MALCACMCVFASFFYLFPVNFGFAWKKTISSLVKIPQWAEHQHPTSCDALRKERLVARPVFFLLYKFWCFHRSFVVPSSISPSPPSPINISGRLCFNGRWVYCVFFLCLSFLVFLFFWLTGHCISNGPLYFDGKHNAIKSRVFFLTR